MRSKPLFKYIGGKTWLTKDLRSAVSHVLKCNNTITTYCEPFVGGMGAFLSICDILKAHHIRQIELSDINEMLIHTYKLVKDNDQHFYNKIVALEQEFIKTVPTNWNESLSKDVQKDLLKDSESFFKQIREKFNSSNDKLDKSIYLIFLQKHSFNGIYRENRQGQYNTPFNWSGKNTTLQLKENFSKMSEVLNTFNVNFKCCSFNEISFNSNTLYYADPPYANESIGENSYNKNSFTKALQVQLIESLLDKNFIYSNHDIEWINEELSKNSNIEIKKVIRKNIMTAKKENRGQDKTEVLAINKIR